MAHQGLVGTLIIKGIPENEAVAIADQYLAMALKEGRLSTPSEDRVTLKGTPERRAVFNSLVAPLAGGPLMPDQAKRMVDDLVSAAAREQARAARYLEDVAGWPWRNTRGQVAGISFEP